VPPQRIRRRIRVDQAVYAQPGTVALLTVCTHEHRPVFADPHQASLVTGQIRLLHGEDWRVLGYTVMPDHVHLLVLNLGGSLLDFMRLLKGRTSKALRGQAPSPLWQRSFHDHVLRRNEDITGSLRYLLENPVRAGLAKDWTAYRWCGSFQWPDINSDFFATHPSNVLWAEIDTKM
jgi:REP element-mobilizing transposase RayT